MAKFSKTTRRNFITRALALTGLGYSGKSLAVTPAQTSGPFYPVVEQDDKDNDLTLLNGHSERAKGQIIEIHGKVVAENGTPITGAFIDVWQANSFGRYNHPADSNPAPLDENFQGWGQFYTNDQGEYRFKTVTPGAYKVSKHWTRPPHIHFKVAKRGFVELTTQMYFADEPLNERDQILQRHKASEQIKLIVNFNPSATPSGEFNIVLKAI